MNAAYSVPAVVHSMSLFHGCSVMLGLVEWLVIGLQDLTNLAEVRNMTRWV